MASASDPFELSRFVAAQESIFDRALAEIRRGRKQSHWMWFIFPQLLGLGHSDMSRRYGIGSLGEARAYLDHPVLGQRLRLAVEALQDLAQTNADEAFGSVDATKLRSSLTLFIEAGGGALYEAALGRWFSGVKDAETLRLLEARQ
jgi:uncharacterized protein (DUF1810 family)